MIKQFFVKLLGGFTEIEDYLEKIPETKERHKVLTLAVKHLFNTIDSDDILRVKGKTWLCGDRTLSEAEKALLISEAAILLNSKLWEVLKLDIKYQANRAMYVEGDKLEDLVAGKLWLYTFDSLKTRLESLAKGSALFNTK